MERVIDLEAHQSGAGLHHRHYDNQRMKKGNKSSTTALKTGSSADDSFTSSNNSDNIKYDDDVDDDDDDDLDPLIESQGLIGRGDEHHRGVQVQPTRAVGDHQGGSRSINIHGQMPFWRSVADRAGWLVGLLVFQSLSSFILARNESLLRHHAVIVQFLTMLVGAGGNAGNQASVGVVRGLAVGTIDRSNAKSFMKREFAMGLALSIILGIAGFIRAAVFSVPFLETIAITSSLLMIVLISVSTGALLPLGMQAVGIDPAHSSTTIQVIMDITGVVITVQVSSLVLDGAFHVWLQQKFSLEGET
jgi:cation transporter-like permease